jgi:prepilin-type processing-associated H-X9-DG protein
MGWLVQLLPYLDEQVTFKHVDFSVSAYDKKNAPVRKVPISTFGCPSEAVPWKDRWQSNYAGCHHDVEAPIDQDNHGVFFLNSSIQPHDVSDGVSHTIFVGEKRNDHYGLGWMSGTRETLRNTGSAINTTAVIERSSDPWAEFFGIEYSVEGGFGAPAYEEESEEAGAGMEAEAVDERETKSPGQGEAGQPSKLDVGGFGSLHPGGANFVFGDGSVQFLSETLDQQVFEQLGHRADGKLLLDRP